MIRIRNRSLPPITVTGLASLQADVDTSGPYADRVETGKRLFKSRNRARNSVFKVVRATLKKMCKGPNRCMYCEDSSATQVDHFYPKDFYPERVFRWENYVWSCGRCNPRKSNIFYIIRTRSSTVERIVARRGAPPTPPGRGRSAIWNPRKENPLDYMMLDLRDTFEFAPVTAAGTDYDRTEKTIKVLGLNERDDLVLARKDVFHSYRARLREYISERDSGASAVRLRKLKEAIRRMPHPTVWNEMVRQRASFPELDQLYRDAPEAVDW